jgi:hypothetical protein
MNSGFLKNLSSWKMIKTFRINLFIFYYFLQSGQETDTISSSINFPISPKPSQVCGNIKDVKLFDLIKIQHFNCLIKLLLYNRKTQTICLK